MPFVKGQSGNPAGRQSDKPLTDSLRRKLFADERKKLNDLVDVMYARAMSGDTTAIKDIWDRLEGKPLQQNENHNINEHVFAEVPETMPREQWDLLTGAQSGKPKSARNGH